MHDSTSTKPSPPPTPLSWRVAIGAAVVLLGLLAFLMRDWITLRGQGRPA